MSDSDERMRQITECIQNLNSLAIDQISEFKKELMAGPTFIISIKSMHQGNTKAFGKFLSTGQGFKFDIFIDDNIGNNVTDLFYVLTDFDLKVIDTEILGVVFQDRDILRIEKISIIYSNEHKRYILNIKSNKPFNSGKVFISTSLVVSLDNYDSHIPDDDGPGSGGGCRPSHPIHPPHPPHPKMNNPFK